MADRLALKQIFMANLHSIPKFMTNKENGFTRQIITRKMSKTQNEIPWVKGGWLIALC